MTDQAWSIKDLLHGFRGSFSGGAQRVVPAGKKAPSTSYNNWSSFPQQIAELRAKRDQNQEQEKQKRTRIDHLEKTVKHQQQELKKRASQVAEFERVRIRHVRYINILTWLRGFLYTLLYLVLFSLYPSLFWELKDKGNLKNLQFLP